LPRRHRVDARAAIIVRVTDYAFAKGGGDQFTLGGEGRDLGFNQGPAVDIQVEQSGHDHDQGRQIDRQDAPGNR